MILLFTMQVTNYLIQVDPMTLSLPLPCLFLLLKGRKNSCKQKRSKNSSQTIRVRRLLHIKFRYPLSKE